LVKAIDRKGVAYAATFEEAATQAALLSQEGDAILTLGAGNVSQIAAMVLDRLS
jgi:UDP-N-acetylmuramate--alanine ligase